MKKISDKVLWDVDTQNDIILRSSKFAVPGAYKLEKVFGEAIRHFEKQNMLIMGTVDAHIGRECVPGTRDENLPLHCIKGTEGQLKIESTRGNILFVADVKYEQAALDKIIEEIKKGKRVYFEKQTQSCETNPNIEYIFKKLKIKEVYFIGVLTNVCIRFADSFFKKLGIKTYLVKNAIKGKDFPGDSEEDAIKEMVKTGAGIIEFETEA
jgi:nicotinamidase-related amidase